MAPAGSPASSRISPIIRWQSGVSSEALSTTVLPQASGMATARYAQNHGGVPRSDAQHDAHGTAHGERSDARLVGGDDLALHLGYGGRRLAQDAGREDGIEHAPSEGTPRFEGDDARYLGGSRLEEIGRFPEHGAALGQRSLGPFGERRLRGGSLRPVRRWGPHRPPRRSVPACSRSILVRAPVAGFDVFSPNSQQGLLHLISLSE